MSNTGKHTYGQILKSSTLIWGSSVLNLALRTVRTKVMVLLLGTMGCGVMGFYMTIADLIRSIAGMGVNTCGVRQIISRGKPANSGSTRASSNWLAKSTPPCPCTSSTGRPKRSTRKKSVNGSRLLLLGLAYKPNVDDARESPTFELMGLFKRRGAEVAYYDPFVPVIGMTREHPHWAGMRSVNWNRKTVGSFDAVVIATNHQSVNFKELANWATCIVDTRNQMAGVKTKPGQVWKA